MAETESVTERKRGVGLSPSEVCELCGAFENLKLCGRCGDSYYCSKEHQRDDWKHHKKLCRQRVVENESKTDIGHANNIEPQKGTTGYNHGGNPTHGHTQSPVTPSASKELEETDSGHTSSEKSRTRQCGVGDHVHTVQAAQGRAPEIDQAGHDHSHAHTVCPASGVQRDSSLVNTDSKSRQQGYQNKNTGAPEALSISANPQGQESTEQQSGSTPSPCSQVSCADDKQDTTYPSAGGQGSSTTESSSGTLSSVVGAQTLSMTVTDMLCGLLPTEAKSGTSGSSLGTGARPKVNQNSSQDTLTTSDVSERRQVRGKRRLNKDIQNNNFPQEPPALAPPEETKLADYVVKCMNNYGICVVDNFMAADKADSILEEVLTFHKQDKFHDGQTVQQGTTNKIRGDKITWVEKGDRNCDHIGSLITRLDALMVTCKGELDRYNINGRTKAMVACYPGDGTGYKRHIDNPKGDGRCVTCIYYLNRGWNVQTDGGLLRIFPVMFKQVADIEPKFDRLLFFWSDRRNPHEVQPAYKTRFAITVWYFDGEERKKAKIQHKIQGLTDSSGYQNFEVQSKPQ